jgi:hypothetical protein
MEINYWWAVIILLGAALLLFWLVKRNLKDKKKFEQETIQAEIKPEKHDQGEDSV